MTYIELTYTCLVEKYGRKKRSNNNAIDCNYFEKSFTFEKTIPDQHEDRE